MRVVPLWQWTRRLLASRLWISIPLIAGACFLFGAAVRTHVFPPSRQGAAGVRPADAPAERVSAQTASTVKPRTKAAPAPVLSLPGEFQHQAALMLGCNELVRHYPEVFLDVVAATYRSTPIVGLISRADQERLALGLLQRRGLPAGAVRFVQLPLDTMWLRDYGPLFVRRADGSVYIAKGEYIEEGVRTGRRPRDNAASRLLGEHLHVPVVPVPLKISGGNLLCNGEGLCVTSVTVIRDNLPAHGDKEKIAEELADHLGVRCWVFVMPLIGESSGHADMLMTFLAPNVAVVGRCDPAVDPVNARLLDRTASLLAGRETSRGPMKVYRIPMPPPRGTFWRSYTNVIMANGTLLMPTFGDVSPELQEEALALYARLLPGWKVVGIRSDSLAPGRGLLHCFSLNVPRYVPLRRFGLPGDASAAAWGVGSALDPPNRAAIVPSGVPTAPQGL